jgi:hypothetical protein
VSVLDDFVSTLLAASDGASPWAVGTVGSVVAGGAADGLALVTVSWQGASVRAAYLVSYTPVVNDVVLMARVGPRLLILGRIGGTPPTS